MGDATSPRARPTAKQKAGRALEKSLTERQTSRIPWPQGDAARARAAALAAPSDLKVGLSVKGGFDRDERVERGGMS